MEQTLSFGRLGGAYEATSNFNISGHVVETHEAASKFDFSEDDETPGDKILEDLRGKNVTQILSFSKGFHSEMFSCRWFSINHFSRKQTLD